MYPCHGMPPLARHYHDLAKLNNLAVVLYPCRGLPPLARHHHDLPKLNDLAVVLDPCHGRLPLARHYHDVAKLNEHGTVEMFLCKYYLIGCPSHLIIIKVALAPCHGLGQTVPCRQLSIPLVLPYLLLYYVYNKHGFTPISERTLSRELLVPD